MLDRFNELQGSSSKTPSTVVRQRPAARAAAATEPEVDDDGDREDEENGGEEGGDAPDDDAGKPDPKAAKAAEEKAKRVPEGVQKRINQVTAQRRAAEQKATDAEFRATRAEKAYELMQSEVERLAGLLEKAGLLDEKDERIAEMDLRQRAAAAKKETADQHQKRVAETTQNLTREERQTQLEDKLVAAIESQPVLAEVLGDADVAREVLVRAARRNLEAYRAGKAKLMSLDDIAAAEAKRLGKIRGDQAAPVDEAGDGEPDEGDDVEEEVEEAPPPTAPTRRMPRTIKHRPGGAVRKVHPPTRDGMLARFQELESQRR